MTHSVQYAQELRANAVQAQAEVGIYSSHGPCTYRPSAVQCPYCREVMEEVVGTRLRRSWRVHSSGLVVGCEMPPTHRAFSCRPCGAIFTQPLEAP